MTAVRASAASSQLFFGEKNAAFRRAFASGAHRLGVGRADFVIVMDLRGAARSLAPTLAKDCALQRRRQHLRQEQVWHRAQLIPRRRMASDIHAQSAQLLNQTPYFGSTGSNLFGNLGAAGDNSGMAHQQPNDAAQPNIGRFVYGRCAASFGGGGDGRIIAIASAEVLRAAVAAKLCLAWTGETPFPTLKSTTDQSRLDRLRSQTQIHRR